MAAVASPTPLGLHSGVADTRYSTTRMSLRTTAARTRSSRTPTNAPDFRRSYVRSNDSSDDEDLAPIKLSAEAQAILGEDHSNAQPDRENANRRPSPSANDAVRPSNNNYQGLSEGRYSPSGHDGSPAPRVISMKGSRPSPRTTLARDGSFMYKRHEKNTTSAESDVQSKTPAPRLQRIHVSGSRSQTRSPQSASTASRATNNSDHRTRDYTSPNEDEQKSTPSENAVPGPSTIMRPRRTDEHGIHSTMRVRRIGTGTLLNGPIRRGMIRRHSDEEDEPMSYKPEEPESPEVEQGRKAREHDLADHPDDGLDFYGSDPRPQKPELQRLDKQQETLDAPATYAPTRQHSSPPRDVGLEVRSKPTPASNGSHPSSRSMSSTRKPIFKIASLPPLESAHDQENEPPPTFKRSKPSAPLLEVHHEAKIADDKLEQQPASSNSPSRPALAARQNNTPHRPAPAPPPKMSLIEAATSNAGNARSKKSVHYVLNNRTYRRLDLIGRGGSSRVFRIMAENYKIFALKRVNLEEADMAAIAGYKGEIDLLRKLSNVDRVIRLFDYEINEEKGVLSVMMELGESDFNKMLNEQLKAENAKLDITFTRHYWKEMLECVQAVHEHDIVHSDLKPANFLLVKGQLKLIDFGIANAIQDNTVNVHRENQIGTPNYMSPESLVCHTPAAGATSGQKILKLGKPSDVWSLGCILYQMTYGQPPFAHITKQFERIMSIPNPKVEIKFPTTGIGGAVVPFGLIRTLRRCLQRDQTMRPTIKELLSEQDPFLNPVAISPEMLGRVIGNVVGYCRKREENMRQAGTLGEEGQSCLPKDEDMRGWPLAFYEKLRQAQEEGSAGY